MNPPRWGPLDRHAMRQYCAQHGVHHLTDPTLDALLTITYHLEGGAPCQPENSPSQPQTAAPAPTGPTA